MTSISQIGKNKFPWNSSCFAVLYCYTTTFSTMHESILKYFKLCTHLFSNVVYHGHTLLKIHLLSNTPSLVSARDMLNIAQIT